MMYIRENYLWILFFVIVNIAILFVAVMDNSIPIESLIYIIMLNTLLLVIFLMVDIRRKKSFFNDIKNIRKHEDIDSADLPFTAFQKEYMEMLERLKVHHFNSLSNEASKTKENLDEVTRFVHDLKMPLTTMQLMLEDIKGDNKAKLMTEWHRLDQKLNEILYMKRLPNIKNDLYIEEVKLSQVFNHLIQKMRTMCMYKNIGFDIHLNVNECVTDLKWLTFIINEIISNAVKYSSNNDIEIRSSMLDGHTFISIKDYGRGIKSEDIKRIFDAGFTSTSDHGDTQSTGMGLYLAKEATQALGIEMDVTSVYGEYTIFVLKMPKDNEYLKQSIM